MTVTFRPAVRENVPLLIGIAGGTGSGKTMSALRLATGLAGGERFGVVDTENGRALHYADQFDFDHAELHAPFSPERYIEAIEAAAKSYGVLVVDSFSHEYSGDGGLLDWHETELQRMAGDDWKRRDAMTFAAWVKPKMAHKRLVSKLLQLRVHLIVCLRAEEKIDIVKRDGKTEVVPKRTLAGHVGWIPITEKSFPYELTTSLVLIPDKPGVPEPIKLQEQHKQFLSLTSPISEETGRRLAEWARGGGAKANGALALSQDDLRERRTRAGISDEQIRDACARLFPDKAASALTDADRGALWLELAAHKASSPSPDEEGEAAAEEPTDPEAKSSSEGRAGSEAETSAAAEPNFVAPTGAADDPEITAANEAAEFLLPVGKHKGMKLGEVVDTGDDGIGYLRYLLRQWKTDPLKSHAWAYAKVYAPDVHEEVAAQVEDAS